VAFCNFLNIPISKSYRIKCESFKSCHCQLLRSYFATYIFLKGSKILRKPPACLGGTLQQCSHATRSITQSATCLLSTNMVQTHHESYLTVFYYCWLIIMHVYPYLYLQVETALIQRLFYLLLFKTLLLVKKCAYRNK
jgi:hypothetical protein